MNKRQAKKARKKIAYPLVDEMNLLTLSPEEYKKAIADYHEWAYKHCRYMHYRDKYKGLRMGFNSYHFPIGEASKKQMQSMIQNARKRNVQVIIQDKSLLQNIYNSTD